MSDRRFKAIGQGLFKGTDGVWKLPNNDLPASQPADVVDLGPAGPKWSRGFINTSAANTSWWRIAEAPLSSGRGSCMLTISSGGGGATPGVWTFLIAKSWQTADVDDVCITLLNASPQSADITAIRVDKDGSANAYIDVKINAGGAASWGYTIQDSNPGPSSTRKWVALATPEETPSVTQASTFDLTMTSLTHNDVVWGVWTSGMDALDDEGGFFIAGDIDTGVAVLELTGNTSRLRFHPSSADYVDLYHDNASLIFKPSATTESFRWHDSGGTNRFLFQVSTTAADNLFDLKAGARVRYWDSTNTDHVDMWHDGTDFRIADQVGTSDIRISSLDISQEGDSLSFWQGAGKDVSFWWGGSNWNFKMVTSTGGSIQFLNTSGAARYSFKYSSTDSSNLLNIFKGGGLKIWDSTNADAIALRHDGTDANFTSTGTTQYTFDKGIVVGGHLRVDDYLRWVDSELTISGGVVTVTGSRHKIDTQSDASTDNLDTISGGQDNQILILSQQSSTRDVTVTESGNINLNTTDGNYAFLNTRSILTLIYDSSLAKWNEVSRSVN